ncbi:hypothetical protein EBZ39_06840 [bacterium]|nr:hypothetical protein [bacterium]
MFANGENRLRADIMQRINQHGANRPRALQTQVGCSSIGVTCDRKLGYQLLGIKGQRSKTPGWAATIGTAIHTHLETVFSGSDEWLTEQPISVKYRDFKIPGTVDLYSIAHRTVIDFKLVGEATLSKARNGRISRQYSVQVQLYGLGLQQAGYKVDKVAILFLPRNRELADAVLWETTFDPTIAHMALDRFDLIDQTIETHGVNALQMLTVADAPCNWCDWFDPAAKELTKGCPGVPLTNPLNNLIV